MRKLARLLLRPVLVGALLVHLGPFEAVVGGVLARGTRPRVLRPGGLPPGDRLRDRRALLVGGLGGLPPIGRRLRGRRRVRAAPATVLWAEAHAAVLLAVRVVHALERPRPVGRRGEVADVARAAVLRGGT